MGSEMCIRDSTIEEVATEIMTSLDVFNTETGYVAGFQALIPPEHYIRGWLKTPTVNVQQSA